MCTTIAIKSDSGDVFGDAQWILRLIRLNPVQIVK